MAIKDHFDTLACAGHDIYFKPFLPLYLDTFAHEKQVRYMTAL